MKIVSYVRDGRAGVGVLRGADVVPFAGIGAIGPGVGIDELESAALDETAAFPYGDADLLPASPNPRRILCVGLNYLSHVDETGRDLPTYPVLFPKFASSLVGARSPIQAPPESTQVDYEGELAVIIGRPGRRIPEDMAGGYILGYSVANDVTMRDYQYKTHQWVQGKAWDDSTPLGPWIVTPDEVDLGSASIRTTLNGEVVQESPLSLLIFSIPRLVSLVSEFTQLEPGDVILTGTPGGVGFRRDPQVFLHPGDEVSVEVDGVGRIDSRVVAEEITGG